MPPLIDKETLDRIFIEQRKLSEAAINTVGMKSYLENLGFDLFGLIQFTDNYLEENMTTLELTEDQQKKLAAVCARFIALGVVVGREVAQ